jgi:hypothetical protein
MDATQVKAWRRQERTRLIAMRMEYHQWPGVNGVR